MARTNLLVDRGALIGNALVVRRTSVTPGDPGNFAGHPSLKEAYGSSALDRFRGAGARYYSFKDGSARADYDNFGYLNNTEVGFFKSNAATDFPSTEDRAFRDENYIAINESDIDPERGETSRPSWNIGAPFYASGPAQWVGRQHLPRYFGDPTVFEFSFRSPGATTHLNASTNNESGADYTPGWHITAAKPTPGAGAGHLPNDIRGGPGIRNLITVRGDDGPWVLGSTEQGLIEGNSLYTLIGPPNNQQNQATTNAWYDYAQGSRTGPPGERYMWDGVYKGFVPQAGRMYYDHAHSFVSPVSPDSPEAQMPGTAVKTATIETSYNFFSKNYENAASGSNISELLLPNRYIILDAIDRGRNALIPELDKLGTGVMSLYSKVSCLGGQQEDFPLPTTRDQISIGKGAITSQDTTVRDQALAYGSTKTYIQNFYSSLPSSNDTSTMTQIKDSVEPLTKHIGFTRDFIVDNFTNYNAEALFPFGINIEFSTRQSNENKRIALEVLDAHPGAYELFLQYAMIMNISPDHPGEWWQHPSYPESNPDSPERSLRGNNLFERTIDFSAVLSQDAGTTYHGFGTWPSPNGTWGGGDDAPQRIDSGNYNLKALNLSQALAYTTMAAMGAPMQWELAGAPSPLTGPTDNTGVAFGDGMLVGRKKIAEQQQLGQTVAVHTANMIDEDKVLFNTTLEWQSFLNDLRNIIVEEERSYKEMLHGDKAYSETIAFRVAKYKASAAGPTDSPIQNFYFPNVGQIELGALPAGTPDPGTLNKIKYIDTQVKYGEKYVYKIYAYNLVIGTQYHYTGRETTSTGGFLLGGTDDAQRNNMLVGRGPWALSQFPNRAGTAKFDAHQFTSLQIIEAPYYTYKPVEVRDLPPVFPEVEVVPFKGVNNKIRLLLQTQNVKYSFTEPEKFKINDADIGKYECIRSAQLGGATSRGALVFGSDDTEITFEIYRMTEKPLSYVDFDGHLLASVPGVTPSGEKAVNIGYDDTIKPNRKYYYTFRTIDYHDAISIPSPIYQVEIVDDNGRMYPIVGVFYPNNHVDRSVNVMKPLRKYLQISPAMAQIAVDAALGSPFEIAGNSGEISVTEAPPAGLLGTRDADGSVWLQEPTNAQLEANETPPQKIFKIRLTSRQTGKKIDLNVKFIQTSTINPEGLD